MSSKPNRRCTVRRDPDLVRKLLLRLEAYPVQSGATVYFAYADPELQLDGFSDDEIDYHLRQLRAAGLIECPGSQPAGGGITFRSLTPDGHDFVDAVREEKAWNATKESARKVGGFTLDLLKKVAKAIAKAEFGRVTGLHF